MSLLEVIEVVITLTFFLGSLILSYSSEVGWSTAKIIEWIITNYGEKNDVHK